MAQELTLIHRENCPHCGDPVQVFLPTDWKAAVEAGAAIPIVGCGNPWHYVFPSNTRDHPGENHQFRTVCITCGEPGRLHVSIITDAERVTIT